MCLQSRFLILSDNLEMHAYELFCCTKHIFPGLRDGKLSFPAVGREVLNVVLETSLSSWNRISRQSKSRGPEWETLICSAIPLWRETGAFPKGNGSIRAARGPSDCCRYDVLSVGLTPYALSCPCMLVLHIVHCQDQL